MWWKEKGDWDINMPVMRIIIRIISSNNIQFSSIWLSYSLIKYSITLYHSLYSYISISSFACFWHFLLVLLTRYLHNKNHPFWLNNLNISIIFPLPHVSRKSLKKKKNRIDNVSILFFLLLWAQQIFRLSIITTILV